MKAIDSGRREEKRRMGSLRDLSVSSNVSVTAVAVQWLELAARGIFCAPAIPNLKFMLRVITRPFVLALGVAAASARLAVAQPTLTDRQRADAKRLIDAALADSFGYNRLAARTDRFGHRLSGSKSLEDAISWILDEMRADKLANVRGEPVMVPHWVRGEESATLVSPRSAPLHMLGLGMSVGTPANGITAPVLVVGSFEELQRRAAEAKGKIVLFDYAFPANVAPMEGYRQAVAYRGGAPAAAAKVGAV